MPYINVNDVYILDNTGKQVDDAVDYALYNSNRNLLDNPFFSVNQRSFSSGSGTAAGAFTVDRWQVVQAQAVRNSDGALTITPSAANYGLCQYIEPERLEVGKTYTMSAIVSGELLSGSFTPTSLTTSIGYFATFSNGVRFYSNYNNAGKIGFWVVRSNTNPYKVYRVKLEVGSYSTLENDAPPNYAEELAKCQRYFNRIFPASAAIKPIGFGISNSATNCRMLIPLPTSMRTISTATLTGSFSLYGGGSYAVTAISANAATQNGIVVDATTSGLTSNNFYGLSATSATSYIDLSADL